MRLHPITALILALTAPLVSQTTWYVDVSALPGGNGSAGAPFTSIQSGVDAALAGDTVLVAPGTYVGSVTIAKDVTVRSTHGPDFTLLGYVNQACGVTIAATSSACIFDGFTITNCVGSSFGCFSLPTAGGMAILSASPRVRRCIIKDNVGGSGGFCFLNNGTGQALAGGVAITAGSSVLLENCVIAGNTGGTGFFTMIGVSIWSGPGATGGVNVAPLGSATLRHCTISGNAGGGAPFTWLSGRGGLQAYAATFLDDCIVWGNAAPAGGFPTATAEEIGNYGVGGQPFVTYSDIRGGFAGTGNFDAHPAFVNPGPDYRLGTGSPCVDRGSPVGTTEDLDHVARPQYFQVDVGAYEWRPPIALTLGIEQPGGASSVIVTTSGGAVGDVYVNLFTPDPENGGPLAGTGPWGGLSMPFDEAAFQLSLGVPPFVGVIDASGIATTSIPLPPGLSGVVIYAISHTVGSTLVTRRSSVVSYTFL